MSAAPSIGRNREPPSIFGRVFSAAFYLVPLIDIMLLGEEMYRRFPATLLIYVLPWRTPEIYYCSQIAPLVIFFLLYLGVVKNLKLHHFVRFNCMQAIVMDIVSMLFSLVRTYFPAEFRWSYLLDFWDMFSWTSVVGTAAYCVFFALSGKYAEVTFVSDSVYQQVEPSL